MNFDPDTLVAGCDEVGRGCIAGPVVAACVILPNDHDIVGIKDSKKLSKKKREELSRLIMTQAVSWAVSECSVETIDEINILEASLMAMRESAQYLDQSPDIVLVDGNIIPKNMPYESRCVVGGDNTYECIAAASIVAKVYRDNLMARLSEQFPYYGFEKHAGYGTKQHMEALIKHGVSPHHRKTFKPVAKLL